jgi:hypothetical protein
MPGTIAGKAEGLSATCDFHMFVSAQEEKKAEG